MFNSIPEYLEFHAKYRPEVSCLVEDDKEISYREANDLVNKIAGRLQAESLNKGDRVILLGKNSAHQFLVYLACARLGVVPVGLNYRLTASEWNFIAQDSGAKYLFADREFLDLREGFLANLPVVSLDSETNTIVSLENWFSDALPLAAGDYPKISRDDTLIQMYTSGTTGNPKGAILCHDNVVNNALQANLATGEITYFGDRFLLIAPAYHAAGLVSTFCCLIFCGTVVIHRDFEPVKFIETLANGKITGTTVIPAMLQFALDYVPGIENYTFPDLKQIAYGASPISESLIRRSMDVFKCKFHQAYGQTEATGTLTILTDEDHRKALNGRPGLLRSCGRPVLGTEIRVVDKQGNDVATGKSGEVIARGKQVMKGYWNLPDTTEKTLVNGWLYTGDAGHLDDNGYLYIHDRIKDMVISGGENIYPAEVENVLIEHPSIADVAVIGVPDAKWGEVPLAVVVAGDGEPLDVASLSNFCRSKLASYKVPKHIEFVDVLPRNLSGKILKKDLRKMFVGKYSS